MINNKYDFIVYGANIAGVVASAILKQKGYNVLLLNRFGFCGGSITESLNLYQKVSCDLFDEVSLTGKIVNKLINEDSYLYYDYHSIIVDPEVLKYELQKIILQNNINILFHIYPRKIDFDASNFHLIVYGKEGDIELNAKRVIDTSTDFGLYSCLSPNNKELVEGFVNVITLPIKDDSKLDDAYRKVMLRDRRWWISSEINTENLFEIEINAQLMLDKKNQHLLEQNSRIQLVPAHTNLIFRLKSKDNSLSNLRTIYDFVDTLKSEDEFILSSIIEKGL